MTSSALWSQITVHRAQFTFIINNCQVLKVFFYRLVLPHRYRYYLTLAGGNRDKCHETLRHGTYYEEYDYYGFAHLGELERRQYVTDAYRNKACRRVNDARQQAVIMDKYLTAETFRDYFRREYQLFDTITQQDAFADMGMRLGHLVVKPVDDCAGRGVVLLHESTPAGWRQRYQEMMKQGRRYIVEQRIVQIPEMASWNYSSVNTVRVNTIIRSGIVHILTANLRCGAEGLFVDNVAQGGFCANIDPATGVIITTACGKGTEGYECHPDSGRPFKGSQIPQWEQLIEAARILALRLPKLTYASWDFALTTAGWTLVEANKGELIADQRNLRRGLRPDFDALIFGK